MDDIIADIKIRLDSLGYKVKTEDEAAIKFSIKKSEENLKGRINQRIIPEGLKNTWIDMAAGMFLFDYKKNGKLANEFDLSPAIKSITEGDTSVSYAISDSVNPANEFENMINSMIYPKEEILAKYRKLVW